MDRTFTDPTRISIQVSLSGFSFNGRPWLTAEHVFTTPELQHKYEVVEISLLTPKVTLVPDAFLEPASARKILAGVASLRETDVVETVPVPAFSATLVYSLSLDESLSRVVAQTVIPVSGEPVRVLPELYFLLRELDNIPDYNKIVASWHGGWLHLVIAQGKSLCLANVFEAPDFTTAEYFIFLALKRLQLNPEVSTVHFRTPLDTEAEMSLYRYFKSVVQL
jgi:hypothetical protein